MPGGPRDRTEALPSSSWPCGCRAGAKSIQTATFVLEPKVCDLFWSQPPGAASLSCREPAVDVRRCWGAKRKLDGMGMDVRKALGCRNRRRVGLLALAAAAAWAVAACQAPSPAPPFVGGTAPGRPGHVFVINLENKGYDTTSGARTRTAPYLSKTLRARGVLLSQYYGIAHNSNPNYLAQISGQASNAMTRDDCPTYAPFKPTGTAVAGPGAGHRLRLPGVGSHRCRPAQCGRQDLERLHGGHGHSLPASRSPAPRTTTRSATRGDQYATRHNPFVYFEAITSSPDCQKQRGRLHRTRR